MKTQNQCRSIAVLMSLKERVAVITGGAGHLGRVMAGALSELGANIVLVDLSKAQCNDAACYLAKNASSDILPLEIDLEREENVRKIPEAVLKHFGRLDILVNNAALVGTSDLKGWAVPFGQQNPDSWRRALEINLTVPFVLTQACTEALRRSGHGSVINIGSTYGLVGPNLSLYKGTKMVNPAAYAASKGGLLQMTRWLATSMAPAVRVNSITPGGIWRNQQDRFVERYKALTPMGRMATEEDFKGAVAYLASDLSSYVTGHNLVVDGGWTTW